MKKTLVLTLFLIMGIHLSVSAQTRTSPKQVKTAVVASKSHAKTLPNVSRKLTDTNIKHSKTVGTFRKEIVTDKGNANSNKKEN